MYYKTYQSSTQHHQEGSRNPGIAQQEKHKQNYGYTQEGFGIDEFNPQQGQADTQGGLYTGGNTFRS